MQPVLAHSRPAGSWQAPIVQPRARAVRRAIGRAAEVSPARHDGPRAGWLSAFATGVAYSYGERVDRRAIALASVVLEGANAFVFTDLSGDLVAIARLLRDDRLRSTAQRLLRDRGDWIEAVMVRLRQGRVDGPVPEAVLSARAAVLLGGLCGGVPPVVVAQLDEVATWWGLCWEAAQGPIADVLWDGAWAALGRAQGRTDPVDGLRMALRGLPDSALVEQIEESLAIPAAPHRMFGAWLPHALTERFDMGEDNALEAAMDAVVAGGPEPFVQSARFLRTRGGKRMRPQLVLAACAACGGDPDDAIAAAAVVEWLHTASLVLDDILDDASLRRGAPTLHRLTDRPFAVAVFLWLLDRIVLASRGLDASIERVVRGAAERLADGQGSELVHTGEPALGRTDYHRIIATKTGALFACAAEVGGLSARAPAASLGALRRYGHCLGLAFQITDDVLDYTADAPTLGKLPGTDLLAGKATLPWLLLRESATPDERARLDADLGRGADWSWIRQQVVGSGAAEMALSEARSHRDDALEALQPLPSGPARHQLERLASQVVERSR